MDYLFLSEGAVIYLLLGILSFLLFGYIFYLIFEKEGQKNFWWLRPLAFSQAVLTAYFFWKPMNEAVSYVFYGYL